MVGQNCGGGRVIEQIEQQQKVRMHSTWMHKNIWQLGKVSALSAFYFSNNLIIMQLWLGDQGWCSGRVLLLK